MMQEACQRRDDVKRGRDHEIEFLLLQGLEGGQVYGDQTECSYYGVLSGRLGQIYRIRTCRRRTTNKLENNIGHKPCICRR